MRYSLEVEPGDPRASAIIAAALKGEGIDVTFEPDTERRSAGQVFDVARGAFEFAGDVLVARAAIKKAAEKWPGIKARIIELGPTAGRHR